MNVPTTKIFNIDYTSPLDGKKYQGEFETHKLNMVEKVRVGVEKSRMTDSMQYNPDTDAGLDPSFMAYADAIAHCKVALLRKPAWFDPETIMDDGLLIAVYKEVRDFQAEIFQPGGQAPAQTGVQNTAG